MQRIVGPGLLARWKFTVGPGVLARWKFMV
jgi:hypothetical protein